MATVSSDSFPREQRDYTTRVDRRLIGLVLMILAGVLVAILAKALGLHHGGRVLLSAAVLGPVAAMTAVYALRLNRSDDGGGATAEAPSSARAPVRAPVPAAVRSRSRT